MTEGMHLQNDWRSNEYNVGNKMKLTGSQGIQHMTLASLLLFITLLSYLVSDSVKIPWNIMYTVLSQCVLCMIYIQLKMWLY